MKQKKELDAALIMRGAKIQQIAERLSKAGLMELLFDPSLELEELTKQVSALFQKTKDWKEAALRYPEDTQQRIGDTWEDVPDELKGYLIEDCNKQGEA